MMTNIHPFPEKVVDCLFNYFYSVLFENLVFKNLAYIFATLGVRWSVIQHPQYIFEESYLITQPHIVRGDTLMPPAIAMLIYKLYKKYGKLYIQSLQEATNQDKTKQTKAFHRIHRKS